MNIDFKGRHAVITGGASGIGLATARMFARSGAKVSVVDRDERGRDVVEDFGGTLFCCDVGDENAVEALAVKLMDGDATVNVLVTCAGVLQRTLTPAELSWAEWDRTMQVHLRGTYACCKSFGSRMADAKQGAIVTISSVAGIGSGPLHAYGPAKAAIAHLSKTLAAEWGPSAVRVNSVAPGFTMTPALEKGLDDTGPLTKEQLTKQAALKRLVEADEIAAAILFLSSDMASAITGITLPVDAGFLAGRDWEAYGGLRQN